MVIYMKSKNSLILGRGIFTIFVVVAFGLIIINEKGGDLFKSKVSEKFDQYLETNFNELKENLSIGDTQYQNNEFKRKITSKNNKNLYFYLHYNNKEITDTYQKDYKEGKTLLSYLNKKLTKEIKKVTKQECDVKAITKLNKYSEKVQERILKEENLLQLKYYYINKEIIIKDWNKETITKEITSFIQTMKENNITPKYYVITIINEQDITTTIEISNLTENLLEANNQEELISDILEDKNSKALQEAKITYQYKN